MMLPEFQTLNQLRLDRDWTWEQLATAMQRARPSIVISYRTLHNLLTREGAKPRDRTLHKIRLFLKSAAAQPPRRVRRPASSAPAATAAGASR